MKVEWVKGLQRSRFIIYFIRSMATSLSPFSKMTIFLFQSPDARLRGGKYKFFLLTRFIRNVDRFVVEIVRLKEIKEKQEAGVSHRDTKFRMVQPLKVTLRTSI